MRKRTKGGLINGLSATISGSNTNNSVYSMNVPLNHSGISARTPAATR
jgi:hypothetical protein